MSAKEEKFFGLIYVKHGAVGTRSEGPDYYLQTEKGDLRLQYQERNHWDPDYKLEFYARRMVEIEGKLDRDEHVLHVTHLRPTLATSIIARAVL